MGVSHEKTNRLTLRDFAIAVLIETLAIIVAAIVIAFLQSPSLFNVLQMPIPVWIFVLSVGIFLTIANFGILKNKVDRLIRKTSPCSKIAENLNDCIKDFSKFF